ncbi:hypothetical protein BO78DRAFT_392713 [Aspergillus sclerotiicarbonarius CBS 121057]|uniref:Uncharacterized protein n=1 Tax=Aspergillus sclerotiicarbonarius (strain CBS 121057 / IBT 28362) TaxID=1448318 RepID=A0A319EVT2_ASPSB|nr:hypothetical protein BO78DRAFT_392713 [Aspergillus sclerotiicarbonarius CBS 121057]
MSCGHASHRRGRRTARITTHRDYPHSHPGTTRTKRRRQSRPCGGPNLDGIMPFAEEAGVRGGNYDGRRATADRQLSLATLTGHPALCYPSTAPALRSSSLLLA